MEEEEEEEMMEGQKVKCRMKDGVDAWPSRHNET